MPILTEKKKVSIDFAYDWIIDEDSKFSYAMKYIETDKGGVVSITTGSGETVELPADMFLEVTTFLAQEGVLKMPNFMPKKQIGAAPTLPISARPTGNSNVHNPLLPTPQQNVPNIHSQPPVDIDPQEILRLRMEAKAKESQERRLKRVSETQ